MTTAGRALLGGGLLAALTLVPIRASANEPEPTAGDRQAAVSARESTRESLLFSADILALIDAARGQVSVMATGWPSSAPPDVLHLSAIVHHGPNDWRVWLNGEAFTVDTRRRGIEIEKVTPDAVRLIWRDGSNRGERRIRLSPNQSYLVAADVVVEGLPAIRRRHGGR